jgi:Ca2+-transporting ATPase
MGFKSRDMEPKKENNIGLAEKEAQKILKRDGFNELASQRKHSWYLIFFDVLREPMLAILIAICAIYVLMGDRADALLLSFFVLLIIGIAFYQQRKTERTLEALRNLSSPRALVIRGGKQMRIPGREVVVGDIIIVREGDRVPADALVLEQFNLAVDESLLTGESLPVDKTADPGFDTENKKISTDGITPFLYSGTLVSQGWGAARVLATGAKTKMGAIGSSLAAIKEPAMPLQREMKRLALTLAIFGLICCAFVAGWYVLFRGGWLDGILAGLTLSMALLPEEIPVVLMVFLTLGAWRMAKRSVLTRNQAAIETLGCATVLCVDKTGTITQNKMQLQILAFDGRHCDVNRHVDTQEPLPELFHMLLEYAVLASQRDPYDPLEIEIKQTGEKLLSKTDRLHYDWELVREYPLKQTLLALSHVWRSGQNSSYVIAAKGAPEAIAELCHFTEAQKRGLFLAMEPLLKKGLRLIAVAKAEFAAQNLPRRQHDFEFSFCGLLGFSDPVRPEAAPAVKAARAAGIRVCMVTGDYPGTARHIARQIGLENPDAYLTGNDLETMPKEKLNKKIAHANIFARVMPEQKLHIIEAFEAAGQVVAMTGDGVNDAPALKAAHIGIAMGQRGTDVAREAADLVLLDDNFASIVAGIRTGRRVFDNLKKAVAYIFSVHIPIAGMALLPVVMGMPVVLMPAHIAFMEMVIDPACTVVYENEPEEKNVMNRRPRKLNEPLFGKKTMAASLLRGLGVLVAVLAVFLFAMWSGRAEGQVRAMTFAAIIFGNLALIVTNLSWSGNPLEAFTNGNKALRRVAFAALVMLALVLYFPPLRSVFHFAQVGAGDLALALFTGIAGAFCLEPFKPFFKRKP